MDRFRSHKVASAKIIAAIQAGDADGAIKLISNAKKKELNSPDERGFTILHVAVESRSLKILDAILKQPHINKNARNDLDETPLFLSLTLGCADNLIIKLTESGCDIRIPNLEQVTPLSLAVKRRSTEVAHLLIKKGADIDAKDNYGYTPLHEAVAAYNYEAICMLLYYGASVNEPCFVDKQTPFMLAVEMRQEKIQEVLFDFVTDFTATNFEGHSILSQALSVQSSLSTAIISQCANLDEFKDIFACLYLSLGWKDASIFKHIFTNVNHARLMQRKKFFLRNFIHRCYFKSEEFVECLCLILNSECNVEFAEGCDILIPLVQKFIEYSISESERLSLLYLLFAAGIPIHYFEFSHVYEMFGFNREVEAILVTKPEIQEDRRDRWGTYLMASNIFYSFTNAEAESALWGLLTDPRLMEDECVRNLRKYLQFFTLSVAFKTNYIYNKTWLVEKEGLMRKLGERNIASLVELCRDKIRKIIIFNKLTHNTYEIYDAIRNLPVPKLIQDILHLKKPLYL